MMMYIFFIVSEREINSILDRLIFSYNKNRENLTIMFVLSCLTREHLGIKTEKFRYSQILSTLLIYDKKYC